MTVPDAVADALDAHDAYDPGGSAWRLTTTRFDARLTATDSDPPTARYELTVRAPTLDAATADEVGDSVADGWRETLERRLAEAPKSTRARVDLETCDLVVEDEEVVITFAFERASPREAANVAKTFAEYVEGTYVEGVIPGYDYVGAVADLLGDAAGEGGDGKRGGTPL